MIEEYKLYGDTLPFLPCPHDCVIKNVEFDDTHLTFIFDDHISLHDSIQHIRPQSKSLIIRYHLIYPYLSKYSTRYAFRETVREMGLSSGR
ncbi:MAG: hypothetical protein IJG45_06075 [Oscillospiraceae bacterium]|nr:hypothetical protein [Oscillospiraceae bacterium]